MKKKVLFSRGKMMVNGISTALISLLEEMDYEKYDVWVLTEETTDEVQKNLIKQINSKAKVIMRDVSKDGKHYTERIRNNIYLQKPPFDKIAKRLCPRRMYEREFLRLFGKTEFDYVIDFEGYNVYYARFCLCVKNARHYIWVHNDIYSEFQKKYPQLWKIFSMYPEFDGVVSCSREIMKVNQENLKDKISVRNFLYAKNCVNFKKVYEGAKAGYKKINNKDGIIRFVNIGRLSLEKNQDGLIRAFARIIREKDNLVLYIIGEGPEREKLEARIKELNLTEKVILTGRISNPYGLMQKCQCFILPSYYEGQPIVIHEARCLRMPVILSDFDSVKGIMIENGQYLIGMDEDSIYEGIKAYLDGKVKNDYEFDPQLYNKEAYKEFEKAVLKN